MFNPGVVVFTLKIRELTESTGVGGLYFKTRIGFHNDCFLSRVDD